MWNLKKLSCGPLSAQFDTMGATVVGLWHKSQINSLVLGFRGAEEYERYPVYAGAVVGPVANRVSKGCVKIDERVWQMPLNEGGQTCLHSGTEGLHARNWNVVSQDDAALRLGIELPDGACGLPGMRRIEAFFRLTETSLWVEITARSDRETVMNIAHHPYWSVDPSSRLCVPAEYYLPTDALNLPTGQIAPVKDTSFDLRSHAAIPGHLDHNYVLARTLRTDPELAAKLTTDRYALVIRTTAPGLQVYSGAGLPEVGEAETTSGPIGPHAGIALEPQFWPDAPNQPGFPKISLEPGETWKQITEYCIDC